LGQGYAVVINAEGAQPDALRHGFKTADEENAKKRLWATAKPFY
jgi:hypothetical protein